ncbi:MAG: hypothetical protein V1725_03485 [archaeon]
MAEDKVSPKKNCMILSLSSVGSFILGMFFIFIFPFELLKQSPSIQQVFWVLAIVLFFISITLAISAISSCKKNYPGYRWLINGWFLSSCIVILLITALFFLYFMPGMKPQGTPLDKTLFAAPIQSTDMATITCGSATSGGNIAIPLINQRNSSIILDAVSLTSSSENACTGRDSQLRLDKGEWAPLNTVVIPSGSDFVMRFFCRPGFPIDEQRIHADINITYHTLQSPQEHQVRGIVSMKAACT